LEKLQSLGLTKEQAADALRYYLLREISTFEDGDYTWEKLVESYNAGLANGIGNLTSRILKMVKNLDMDWNDGYLEKIYSVESYNKYLEKYELQKATDEIWNLISQLDIYIQKNEPFKVAKIDPQKAKEQVGYLISEWLKIGHMLIPVLPKTAEKILKFYTSDDIPHLFPRIE
jgi:methionyl-tRNA synthetase